MLAQFRIGTEERLGVGEVEVPGQKKRPFQLRLFMQKRMAEVFFMPSVGRVTQMSQENAGLQVSFELVAVADQFSQGINRSRFFKKIRGFPYRRLRIDQSYPRSVLPPVVLFFQEQDEFVEGAFCVKLWRPLVKERHSAFVFDLF